jgi:Ca-activated chloride channel family protein
MRRQFSRSIAWVPIVLGVVSGPAAQQSDTVRFSTATHLVVLSVRVTDRRGEPIAHLDQSAFTLFDDGRPQRISLFSSEDAPATLGIVVDSSVSMWHLRDLLLAGAEAFARMSHPDDELFAIAFNEQWWPALPPDSPFTGEAAVLRDRLAAAVQPRGRTALFDAVSAGIDYAARGRHTRKALVLISDGGDNASTLSFEALLARTQASNVVIYGVALIDPAGRGAKPDVLQRLARGSGGEAFTVRSPGQLQARLEEVARDIRHAYTLGYLPSSSEGRYHTLRVAVSSPGHRQVVVRTRDGYRDVPSLGGGSHARP